MVTQVLNYTTEINKTKQLILSFYEDSKNN